MPLNVIAFQSSTSEVCIKSKPKNDKTKMLSIFLEWNTKVARILLAVFLYIQTKNQTNIVWKYLLSMSGHGIVGLWLKARNLKAWIRTHDLWVRNFFPDH